MLAHLATEMGRRFLPVTGDDTGAPVPAGGHIHQTWLLADRVVQRLNLRVFPDLDRVVGTVVTVSAHLRSRLAAAGVAGPDLDRRAPAPLATAEGAHAVVDDHGGVWRAFSRVRGARSPDRVSTPAVAWSVGGALGLLVADLADLPPPPEAIPGFKDFARRRDAFEAAVAEDAAGRRGAAAATVESVRRHHGRVDVLERWRAAGDLPDRTVHNDAKAANVLLDEVSGEALCVVDLDTVAGGTVLFDVGDLLRSVLAGASDAGEGAPGSGSGEAASALLRAALEGWLAHGGALLGPRELELLPAAGPLMAYENALRFLTDHLSGDRYFAVDRPGQNLARARAQLRVLDALEETAPLLAAVSRR